LLPDAKLGLQASSLFGGFYSLYKLIPALASEGYNRLTGSGYVTNNITINTPTTNPSAHADIVKNAITNFQQKQSASVVRNSRGVVH
jgi:hypothetical protein